MGSPYIASCKLCISGYTVTFYTRTIFSTILITRFPIIHPVHGYIVFIRSTFQSYQIECGRSYYLTQYHGWRKYDACQLFIIGYIFTD